MIRKILIKVGATWLAKHIPPRFVREYRKDVLNTMRNITVHFNYLMDQDRRYEIKIGEIYCPCGGKIEEFHINKPNKKGKRKEYKCNRNRCNKKYNLNKKNIKNEISGEIRNRYPEEIEYLIS